MSEEYHSEAKKVTIVGGNCVPTVSSIKICLTTFLAGVFGLSLAIALRERGRL